MPKIEKLNTILENFSRDFPGSNDCRRIGADYNRIVSQTKDFVKKSGFDDVVIGLSGGIDSALVAKIAIDAFGANHVHGMILPGPYSSQASINDATSLSDNLAIETKTQMINSGYEAIMANLDAEDGSLTSQNVQARLRMIYLMAASNQHGWIMLNTANKSEVYTGYSTLYGDMAGGFAPLGNTYKTDVFKMATYVNLQAERRGESVQPIPQNIIDKPPSAELTENQTDENSLGIDYPMLDKILVELVDCDRKVFEVVALGYPEREVQLVATKVKRSEYKRRYEPPCPANQHVESNYSKVVTPALRIV